MIALVTTDTSLCPLVIIVTLSTIKLSLLAYKMRHRIDFNKFVSHDYWRFRNSVLSKGKYPISSPNSCFFNHLLLLEQCFTRKLFSHSTLDSYYLCLTFHLEQSHYFYMHITQSIISAIMSELDRHKAHSLCGISAIILLILVFLPVLNSLVYYLYWKSRANRLILLNIGLLVFYIFLAKSNIHWIG